MQLKRNSKPGNPLMTPAAVITVRESLYVPLAIVILVACVVNLPCLLWGLQFGHDHNLHITYLHFLDEQRRAGEFYPRWISALNFGAGSPIFFVQYPLPYYVASLCRRVFGISATAVGDAHAIGLFIFLTGIAAGVFSWLWCSVLTNPVAAVFASVAYLTMPYLYGCDVYYRAAIGEYSALAWIPLVLFFAHWIGPHPPRAIAGMGLAIAAVTLSNLFTAILFLPFLFLYVITIAAPVKIWKTMLSAACALALGIGASSVYFLPMMVHRSFFSLRNLVNLRGGIFNYRDHLFPIAATLFPSSHTAITVVGSASGALGLAIIATLILRSRRGLMFAILIYTAVFLLLLTCAASLLHRIGFFSRPEAAGFRAVDVRSRIFLITFLTSEAAFLAYASLRDHAEMLPNFFVAACLACYVLTTRLSEWIWQHVSFLCNIQFPWRLTGILSVFALGLVAFVARDALASPQRRRNILLVCMAWCLVMVGSCFVLDIPQVLSRPFFTEIRSKLDGPFPAYATVSELPSLDELGPNEPPLDKPSFLAGGGNVTLSIVSPRHLRVEANCFSACTVLLKLVYYPFWQAREITGQLVALQPTSRAGLSQLSLSAGIHEVDLELPVRRAETWGGWISLICLLIISTMFAVARDARQESVTPFLAGAPENVISQST
jgi:hypothetical protein